MPDGAEGFVEERLFTQPAGMTFPGVTADGHLFGLLFTPDGKTRFVWDGTAGEPFDGVRMFPDQIHIMWSGDGRHVAYLGGRGGRSFVGRDGGEEPTFEIVTSVPRPTWSPDGAHLAYGAADGGTPRLVVDGAVVGELALAPNGPVFSHDGARLAYVEMRGERPATDPAKLWRPFNRIVVDGVPGPWFRGMPDARGALQFSPDGRRFAFYQIDDKGGGRWTVDGVEQRWVNDVRPLHLRRAAVLDPPLPARFSPDSRRFAYLADVKEKGVAVIEDDVLGPRFHAATWPVFSPDSRRLAYGAQTFGKQAVVVVDGRAGKERPVRSLNSPVFSPDGAHWAASLDREDGGPFRKHLVFTLLLDDEPIVEEAGEEAGVWPHFSADDTRVAWWLQRGNEFFIYVNAERSSADNPDEPGYTSAGHLVYAGPQGDAMTVFVDGRPGPLAEAMARSAMGVPLDQETEARGRWRAELGSVPPVDFQVSPDGEHVAWAGRFGGVPFGALMADDAAKAARPVLDDQVGPAYDRILGWAFDAQGTAVWFAQRGDETFRVTAAVR